MTQIPEKIEPPTMTTTASEIVTICPLNQEAVAINQLIDYITAREKNQLENDDKLYKKIVETAGEVHTMYKELTSRIDIIAGNQLEMKREGKPPFWGMAKKGEPDIALYKGQDQPKRWRAKLFESYWYVTDAGGVNMATERNDTGDSFCYSICNYHKTEQEAKAYKAKLLADNAQV